MKKIKNSGNKVVAHLMFILNLLAGMCLLLPWFGANFFGDIRLYSVLNSITLSIPLFGGLALQTKLGVTLMYVSVILLVFNTLRYLYVTKRRLTIVTYMAGAIVNIVIFVFTMLFAPMVKGLGGKMYTLWSFLFVGCSALVLVCAVLLIIMKAFVTENITAKGNQKKEAFVFGLVSSIINLVLIVIMSRPMFYKNSLFAYVKWYKEAVPETSSTILSFLPLAITILAGATVHMFLSKGYNEDCAKANIFTAILNLVCVLLLGKTITQANTDAVKLVGEGEMTGLTTGMTLMLIIAMLQILVYAIAHLRDSKLEVKLVSPRIKFLAVIALMAILVNIFPWIRVTPDKTGYIGFGVLIASLVLMAVYALLVIIKKYKGKFVKVGYLCFLASLTTALYPNLIDLINNNTEYVGKVGNKFVLYLVVALAIEGLLLCFECSDNTLKEQYVGYVFILPWLAGVIIFLLSPMMTSFKYSLSNIAIKPKGMEITPVGYANYTQVWAEDATFPTTLMSYFVDTIISVPVIVVFALIISMLLNGKIKFKGFFRLVFFLPVIVVSGPVMGMLTAQGAATVPSMNVTAITGILEQYLPTFAVETVANLFNNMIMILWYSGMQILIFLSALQKIDATLYEAAKIDGGSGWECFWKITLPTIKPMILLNAVYTAIFLSNNEQNEIIVYIQNMMFQAGKGYGYASAMAWMYALVETLMVGAIALLLMKKRDAYDKKMAKKLKKMKREQRELKKVRRRNKFNGKKYAKAF